MSQVVQESEKGAEPQLEVTIGKLRMKNPVMAASGTSGYGEEMSEFFDLSKLGAICVKGLTLKPREGNPPPRICETPAGMINAIGLQNVGVDGFIEEKMPFLRQHDIEVVANVSGSTFDEFAELSRRLGSVEGIAALEINISCPNLDDRYRRPGQRPPRVIGQDPQQTYDLTRILRNETDATLIVKLSPEVTDIGEMADAVAKGGADAISLINTMPAMVIDVERRRSRLWNVVGGLSGPAIRPIAVRMVWEVAQCCSLPIIGIGGIMNARDALEFIIAGAQAVQVGTAIFIDPRACPDVADGIREYLVKHQLRSIHDLVGTLTIGTEEPEE